MAALKGNARGNNEELEASTKVADLSKEISKHKVVVAKQRKLTGNVIQQYADTPPRVTGSQSPKVEQKNFKGA